MEVYMFPDQNEGQIRRPGPQVHYHNYHPQSSQLYVHPSREGVINSSQAAQKYGGFVICEHKQKPPAATRARSQAPRLVPQAAKPAPSTTLVHYVVNQEMKPRSMSPLSYVVPENNVGSVTNQVNPNQAQYNPPKVVNQDMKPRQMSPLSYENNVGSVTNQIQPKQSQYNPTKVVNQDMKPRPITPPLSYVVPVNNVGSVRNQINPDQAQYNPTKVVNQDMKTQQMPRLSYAVPENNVGFVTNQMKPNQLQRNPTKVVKQDMKTQPTPPLSFVVPVNDVGSTTNHTKTNQSQSNPTKVGSVTNQSQPNPTKVGSVSNFEKSHAADADVNAKAADFISMVKARLRDENHPMSQNL